MNIWCQGFKYQLCWKLHLFRLRGTGCSDNCWMFQFRKFLLVTLLAFSLIFSNRPPAPAPALDPWPPPDPVSEAPLKTKIFDKTSQKYLASIPAQYNVHVARVPKRELIGSLRTSVKTYKMNNFVVNFKTFSRDNHQCQSKTPKQHDSIITPCHHP